MSPTSDHTPHHTDSEADPRFFRAVQYVLGELSETDRDAFEAALADDVTLCIAVAEATQLVSGIHATLKPTAVIPVDHPAAPKRDRWSAAAFAAAAIAVAATLLATFSAPHPAVDSQAIKLVSLWRDAGRSEIGAASSEPAIESVVATPIHDDHVPPWMLAAVSLEHRPARSPLEEPTEPWEDN